MGILTVLRSSMNPPDAVRPSNPSSTSSGAASLAFLLVAVALSLFMLSKMNPFYIPAVDDSAIVMRYLLNFQKGYFFVYNIADGPVYGVSGILFGLIAGGLSRIGLDPQPSILITSFLGSTVFFYFVQRIFYTMSGRVVVAIICCLAVFVSAIFVWGTFFIGLEASVNLAVTAATFYFFTARANLAFHIACFLSILSKLDTISLVFGLQALNALRAWSEGNLRAELRMAALLFLAPCVAWFVAAGIIFGNPLPQSFLSKFLFRPKAPPTSWFPFIEPFMAGWRGATTFFICVSAALVSVVMSVRGRNLFSASFVFAMATVGTLLLYFVYNPGEKMAWYYTLPEFLLLMSVFTLPFNVKLLPSMTERKVFLVASLVVCALVVIIRGPEARSRLDQMRYGQVVFEGERDAAAQLANDVAPKDRPVLWNGHGYPAYRFNGYVADYAGLNSRLIWKSLAAVKRNDPAAVAFIDAIGLSHASLNTKAEYYLIDLAGANVIFQHDLVNPTMQRHLNLRLAGSFYNVGLIGFNAYRIFVRDPGYRDVVVPIAMSSLQVSGETKRQPMYVVGRTVELEVPAQTVTLLFGIGQSLTGGTVDVKDEAGATLGTCQVPPFANARYHEGVTSCEVAVPPSASSRKLSIVPADAGPMRFFEPSARITGQAAATAQ